MAQTTQIVPKFSFPYVDVVINDYTQVANDEIPATEDTSIKEAYAVNASKGIDNVWVNKTSRLSAEKTFGMSNFKKLGQPYMQALHVLDRNNSQAWIMRVMPENATYSNAIVSAFYKADIKDDVADAHKRKFRVKLTSKTATGIKTPKELADAALLADDDSTKFVNGVCNYRDGEGYTQAPLFTARYAGHGTCGDYYSMRLSQAYSYEKEFGIKMYNYEVINSEMGLDVDANYVGAFVTSAKYGNQSTTLIDDVLDDAEIGLAPIDVRSSEDGLSAVYEEYVKFIKALHTDLISEYEEKLDAYKIPEEMMNGSIPVSDEYKDKYLELREIDNLIDETETKNIPDLDGFDIIFGLKVGSSDALPCISYPEKLTDAVDTTSEDYVAADYTSTESIIDFSSAKGLKLENGDNGYFDNPRTIVNEDGESIKYTFDDELELCYKNAYNGSIDKKIISSKRMPVTAFWDANYPMSVKKTLADLVLARNDCRLYLDCGIIPSLSIANVNTLISDYACFSDKLISKDIHNYFIKEDSTNKKTNVTISYFLSAQYVDHMTNVGFHIPFVNEYAKLSGHVKDSLAPVLEDYDTDMKTKLYDNRFNYFECIRENEFQRSVQNTSQMDNTDLLEENNVTILYNLKRNIERDTQTQLYNFADTTVRQDFIAVEKARYASWAGNIVESFDITFSTSQYEFNHSILHCYVSIVFRGLTKQVIVEVDLNKRQYATATGTSNTGEAQ